MSAAGAHLIAAVSSLLLTCAPAPETAAEKMARAQKRRGGWGMGPPQGGSAR